jgi:hypothetical protein
MGDFQCRECGNDAMSLCEKCNTKYEDAELTRLRAELAEAQRHAKVLVEAAQNTDGEFDKWVDENSQDYERAFNYAKGLKP